MPASAPAKIEERLEHEIDPSLQRELHKYPGKWVAITRSELIAAGDDPAKVLAKARADGYSAPILYHVPQEGDSAYFL